MSACFIFGAKVYCPRNPRTTKLYRIVSANYDDFLKTYPERFEHKVIIERILRHLGLFEELPRIHSPPHTGPPEPRITYEPFYDDLSIAEQIELAQAAR